MAASNLLDKNVKYQALSKWMPWLLQSLGATSDTANVFVMILQLIHE
jgi:hypothetical protein